MKEKSYGGIGQSLQMVRVIRTVVVYQGYDAVTWIPSPDDYPGWCILVIPPRGQNINKPYNRFGEWIAFGLDSPKHYYYRGAFADTVRSIDFIFAQPCFDGQNLLLQVFRKVERSH